MHCKGFAKKLVKIIKFKLLAKRLIELYIIFQALVYSSCRDAGVTDGRKTIEIDLDGAGPLKPFPARCKISPDRILTLIGHSSEHSTLIDGYQEHGSYEIIIKYTAGMEEIEALIERSRSCVQKLSYSCRLARLFNSPCEFVDTKIETICCNNLLICQPMQRISNLLDGGYLGRIKRWITGLDRNRDHENVLAAWNQIASIQKSGATAMPIVMIGKKMPAR